MSRLLSHQRRLTEVRSATQPLGSPQPLERARLASRLGEVNAGFHQLADGAEQLSKGLTEGAAKLRAAIWLEETTGLTLTGKPVDRPTPKSDASVTRASIRARRWPRASSRHRPCCSGARGCRRPGTCRRSDSAFEAIGDEAKLDRAAPRLGQRRRRPPRHGTPRPRRSEADRRSQGREPAGGLAPRADPRRRRRRPDRRRRRPRQPRGHRDPERSGRPPRPRSPADQRPDRARQSRAAQRSFAAYITPDGHRARIDLTQADRIFSHDAMDQVLTLRRRLNDFLGEYQGIQVTAQVAGANAESADIRDLTHADQVQSWFIVPIGVFLVLIVALRDPLACLNLVATMVLTYAFALGATHLVFVTCLGAEGLDWKVPYFLFVLLIAVGVDYNVFLMTRLNEESQKRGLRDGIVRAIGQTGGLISSAAVITASSFASFLFSPLGSLRQLGFALVVGILIDAIAGPAAPGPLRPLAAPPHPRGARAPHRRSQGPTRIRGRARLISAVLGVGVPGSAQLVHSSTSDESIAVRTSMTGDR